jgi:hypothetical protein
MLPGKKKMTIVENDYDPVFLITTVAEKDLEKKIKVFSHEDSFKEDTNA